MKRCQETPPPRSPSSQNERWRAPSPVQVRGKGVTLMRLKDARLADLRTFDLTQGLSWSANGKERRVADLATWRGPRAGSGRMVPNGFPRNNRFS